MMPSMSEYEKIKWAAFARELEKKAFVQALGRGVINAGLGAAKMLGPAAAQTGTSAVRSGMRMMGSQNLQRAVGAGALGRGAGAVGGYVAGRMGQPRPMGY